MKQWNAVLTRVNVSKSATVVKNTKIEAVEIIEQ